MTFEIDVRDVVNSRLGRCAITSICRLDSRAATPLQVVDILTSSVAFEFRQAAGSAGQSSPKAHLAEYVRQAFGVRSWLQPPVITDRVNVRKYVPGLATRRRTESGRVASRPQQSPLYHDEVNPQCTR